MTSDCPRKMIVVLSSGRQIKIDKVRLYPAPMLKAFVALRVKAQQELGGFSSGIGFLGSPSWVLGSAAVLGVLESIITSSKAKKGAILLQEANEFHQQIQQKGILFDTSEIEGIESPDLANWKAYGPHTLSFDLKSMSSSEVEEFSEERGLGMWEIAKMRQKNEVIAEEAEVPFILGGDEFLWIETGGQLVTVRWSFIESYQII